MEQLMVISVIGDDRNHVVHNLTHFILDCGGNIKESRMTTLGSEFTSLLLICGNWHAITRLENDIGEFSKNNGLSTQIKQTKQKNFEKELLPYAIDVVCLDQPGIVNNISGFFVKRNIGINEVTTQSYSAAQSGTLMFSLQMLINIPASIHISGLREEFAEFCDQFNLDAIMEPVKNQIPA